MTEMKTKSEIEKINRRESGARGAGWGERSVGAVR